MSEEQQPVKRYVVHIPSHEEVLQNSRPQPPQSFFRPSSSSSSTGVANSSGPATSFTDAFSFVRQTEFYTPPPVPPPAPPGGPPGGSSTSGFTQELKYGRISLVRGDHGIGKLHCLRTIEEQFVESLAEAAVPLPALTGQSRNAIIVSRRQQGNPVLKYIRNLRWVYGEIVPDYILGQTTCALYLSLRYHLLHPDYLYFRIRELQKSFRLRVILCHVDVEDVIKPLHEVTKTALLHDCSLLCAWSLEECARYLETLKMYENKPADNIQERTDHDYLSRLTSSLTTVRHVNKTDVITLGTTFGTLAAVVGASMEELARCPGIGERKVKRLYDAFHEPFRRTTKQLRVDSMGVITDQGATIAASNPADTEGAGVTETASVGVSKIQDSEPEVSVREALDAAYVKVVERKVATNNETSTDRSNTNGTKTVANPEIEVIDIT